MGNNYPKRFEVLENNGKILKFRVEKLTNGLRECFIKHFINDKDQGEAREITVPKTLEYTIEESGKHTFSFFNLDPDVAVVPLEDGIDMDEDNEPIWEQDIFVIKHDSYGLSEESIEKLAREYAPFVFMDKGERYLPASLAYLLNRDEAGNIKDEDLDIHLTLKFQNTENIPLRYNDLPKVLPYNGERDSVLDTIGISVTKLIGHKTKRDALQKRKGDPDNVTVYYSCIPNPKKKQIIINYHFLYAYDPKMEEKDEIKKTSHIFDRESISIVFTLRNTSSQTEKIEPDYVIYGAHLEGQTMGAVQKDKNNRRKWNNLQKWRCGRVKVMWKDVYKIKEHPCVAVAKGSHAPYPAPGHYAVYFLGKTVLVEPAGTGKALIPQEFDLNDDIKKKFKKSYQYRLKDLELGNINSNSWNSILAYSGYIVDILGTKNAKFPPYTERELNIDKWVNGDRKDRIYNWVPTKVEKEANDKFVALINSMNSNLA